MIGKQRWPATVTAARCLAAAPRREKRPESLPRPDSDSEQIRVISADSDRALPVDPGRDWIRDFKFAAAAAVAAGPCGPGTALLPARSPGRAGHSDFQVRIQQPRCPGRQRSRWRPHRRRCDTVTATAATARGRLGGRRRPGAANSGPSLTSNLNRSAVEIRVRDQPRPTRGGIRSRDRCESQCHWQPE